ncbi:TetR/AcrR family transcriptional regulator [Paractinoplanes toevensis]|uniref:TetR family transcriptional regulator n=1 Tax=Paractinoplanes toevensis TaxID=571911 RepID=A0A919TJV9_9ACTN|nr:TetR/AcrR family transcriptional regulator [Actinoplanes toevensis]GIM95366.1 TetR family transcriptional regulator [Actinoplanes toevensis]
MTNGKRVRLTADVRRRQLVDEATTLIARIGYHRFSIKALAEATGLTRAGVLHHVGSKEQLLLDVLALRDERDNQSLDPELNVRHVLDSIVRRNLAQPEIVRLYTVLAAEALDPAHPAHAYFAERLRTGTTLLGDMLGDHELAVEVYSFMDGIQLNWLRDPTIDMWRQWQRFADALFRVRS